MTLQSRRNSRAAIEAIAGNGCIGVLKYDLIGRELPSMRISRKTDYALRALFTLVEHQGQGPIPIRELARRNNVPKPFLEHIMLDLKRNGWVKSVPGKKGGYELARPAAKITMAEVIAHFDDVLDDPDTGGRPAKGRARGRSRDDSYLSRSLEPAHRFRKVLHEISHDTARAMQRATLASVYAGLPVRAHSAIEVVHSEGDGI